jgi:AraC-like DNA-binding protein
MVNMETPNQHSIACLKKILLTIPHRNHFKIHRSYNITVPKDWGFSNRINDDFHIVYVVRGKGLYQLEGVEEPLFKGKLIFVSDGYRYTGKLIPDHSLTIIPFRFGLYPNSSNKIIKSHTKPFCAKVIPSDTQRFRELFEKLYKFSSVEQTHFYKSLGNSLINQILIGLYSELVFQESNDWSDSRMERVKSFIEEHPFNKINLLQLSELSGLSRKYLSRLFRKQYGITPKEYQFRVRISHARFLLEETVKTIQEIADELGYSDQFVFSKQFKKVVGCSPSKYKKSSIKPHSQGFFIEK